MNMLLRRLGNKKKIAGEIIKHFPKHDCYIEPFFRAGGMFFSKPLAKYNYLNDSDEDIYNLFMQVEFNKEEFYKAIERIPYHKSVWNWLKELKPTNDLYKAVKFVILSNWGLLGKPQTLRFDMCNHKHILLKNILKTYDYLVNDKDSTILFNCADFRKFIKEFSLGDKMDIEKTFIYADPPYLCTTDNYKSSFKEQDSIDLFDSLQSTGCKWAMSEFDNPFILQQAKERGLNVITIGERRNLGNRRAEILVTNYEQKNTLF